MALHPIISPTLVQRFEIIWQTESFTSNSGCTRPKSPDALRWRVRQRSRQNTNVETRVELRSVETQQSSHAIGTATPICRSGLRNSPVHRCLLALVILGLSRPISILGDDHEKETNVAQERLSVMRNRAEAIAFSSTDPNFPKRLQ